MRICMKKNRTRLKGATSYQNMRRRYGEPSAPKLKSVFASISPKLLVSFKTLRGIEAAFQPSVFLFGLGARENFKFDNARCDNGVWEEGRNSIPVPAGALAGGETGLDADFREEFSLKLRDLGSEPKIRPDGCPEPLRLRNRKPFKIVLHHQKGFQLITVVIAHAHEAGANA